MLMIEITHPNDSETHGYIESFVNAKAAVLSELQMLIEEPAAEGASLKITVIDVADEILNGKDEDGNPLVGEFEGW
jgi:hypothetical protein